LTYQEQLDAALANWQREAAETRAQAIEEFNAKAAYEALATQAVKDGPDLSNNNTVTDWSVLAQNVGFVFLKVADGDVRQGTDGSLIKTRITAARGAGITLAPYQFARVAAPSNRERNGRIECAMSIHFAFVAGWPQPGDLPLAYDFEGESLNAQPVAKCAKHLLQWINTYEFTMQHKPILYGPPSVWNQIVPELGPEQRAQVAACPLWLADWTPPADVPAPWSTWSFWQYTDKGTVPGTSGTVDMNHFSGSQTDLAALRIQ
jgi:lysozyme